MSEVVEAAALLPLEVGCFGERRMSFVLFYSPDRGDCAVAAVVLWVMGIL